MKNFRASYRFAHESGLLGQNVRAAADILQRCELCPRRCRVDRTRGETGVCRTGPRAWVSSCNAHFGEEAPLVGRSGSGTIFFTHCNLGCSFCQNYDISHNGQGSAISDAQLAEMMLRLQYEGCHNINFVTPSHVVPQILAALEIAVDQGLTVPLVYNSSGYDAVATLKLLDGIVDIYMPDFKFWDPNIAAETCNAPDYPEAARAALKEMHRQVGDLVLDPTGIARRGVLVRHLVLPGGLAGTRDIMRFIAHSLSADTYVNIMGQYRPCGGVKKVDTLGRPPTPREFKTALQEAKEEGITRLDKPHRVFMIV